MNHVLLVVEPDADAQPLAEALSAEIVPAAALAERFAALPDCRAVVLLRPLHTDLARLAPSDALDLWTHRAEIIAGAAKQNRRAMLVLDESEALSMQRGATTLALAWLRGEREPDPVALEAVDEPLRDLVTRLAAVAMLASDPQRARLSTELDALTAPLAERPAWMIADLFQRATGGSDALAKDLENTRSEAGQLRPVTQILKQNYAEAVQEAEERAAALEAALDLLRTNYADAVWENETQTDQLKAAVGLLSRNYAEVAEEADTLKRAHETGRADRAALRVALAEAKRKSKALARDRAQLQADIGAMQAALDAQAAEMELLKRARIDLEEAMNATHSSTSWRVTAPIRAMKTAFGGPGPSTERDK